MHKMKKGAVALRNSHAIYCFGSLKLKQYIVEFILSATAPFLFSALKIFYWAVASVNM